MTEKITLIINTNNFWEIGTVLLNNKKIATINKFYEVTPQNILIFDTKGGTGIGYSKGELINKISLINRDFELKRN